MKLENIILRFPDGTTHSVSLPYPPPSINSRIILNPDTIVCVEGITYDTYNVPHEMNHVNTILDVHIVSK